MLKFTKKICVVFGAGIILSALILSIIYNLKGEVTVGKFMLQKTAPLTLDQTYVISLDRTPERYTLLDKELTQNKVKHIRFSAVDGLTLPMKDNGGNLFNGKDLKDSIVKLQPNQNYNIQCPSVALEYSYNPNVLSRSLRAGEFGCFCSHSEVWQKIINANYKAALILEDDAKLSVYFEWQLNKLMQNIPKNNWDVIFLFVGEDPEKPKFTILNNQFIYKYKSSWGQIWHTTAYIVSNEGAKKILHASKKFSLPIDNVINDLIAQNKINAYITTQQYIDHDHRETSTIGNTASSNR